MNSFTSLTFVCAARCVLNALRAGRFFGLAFVLIATTVANAQVASGSVKAWGNNNSGQTTIPAGDLGPCTQIAAGNGHTIAIQTNGSVRAWGWNNYGQTTVPADLGPCTKIAAGENHTVAIQTNGSVRAWGLNNYGQT